MTGDLTDLFKFPDGNVLIKHKPEKGSDTETFDPVTCLFTFTEKALEDDREQRVIRQRAGQRHLQGGREGFGCEENKDQMVHVKRAKGNFPC